MTAAALLGTLRELGIQLEVAGDRIRWAAPRGVLTDELRRALGNHKVELIALLAQHERAVLVARFIAAEALIPRAVVDDPERWATWRQLDRLLTAVLKAGDLRAAEGIVAEAERWTRDVSASAPAEPKELNAPATCPTCGGTFDGILSSVLGRPAVKCGACRAWELVRGGGL